MGFVDHSFPPNSFKMYDEPDHKLALFFAHGSRGCKSGCRLASRCLSIKHVGIVTLALAANQMAESKGQVIAWAPWQVEPVSREKPAGPLVSLWHAGAHPIELKYTSW